jgi:hypothetical protein
MEIEGTSAQAMTHISTKTTLAVIVRAVVD